MNRTICLLIANVFGSLLLAAQAAAQQELDEPPAAAPAATQAAPAANPLAQPVPPAAVHPPTAPAAAFAEPQRPRRAGSRQPAQPAGVQPSFSRFGGQPRSASQSKYETFFLQGGGRGGAVIVDGPDDPNNVIRRPVMLNDDVGISFSLDDPEMAKLTQSEHELARQSHELISKYAETEDGQLREKAKAQLRDMLDKQFDLQNQRRELELSRVEDRLRKLREQLKRRSDARTEIVDRHLEHLISDAEGLGWTPPSAGAGNNPLEIRPFYAPGGPGPRPAPAIAR